LPGFLLILWEVKDPTSHGVLLTIGLGGVISALLGLMGNRFGFALATLASAAMGLLSCAVGTTHPTAISFFLCLALGVLQLFSMTVFGSRVVIKP
jgi:hypothetical protein